MGFFLPEPSDQPFHSPASFNVISIAGIHFAYISCCYVRQTLDKLCGRQEQPFVNKSMHEIWIHYESPLLQDMIFEDKIGRGFGRLWAIKALEGQAIVHKQWLAPPMLCLLTAFRSPWNLAIGWSRCQDFNPFSTRPHQNVVWYNNSWLGFLKILNYMYVPKEREIFLQKNEPSFVSIKCCDGS